MTDIAAAIGIEQLKKCDEFWEARQRIAMNYAKAFADLKEIQLPTCRNDVQHAWHLFVIQLNLERLKINRNQFLEALREKEIGTSVHFIPLHLHPYYRDKFGYKPEDFPNASTAFERIISLPIYPKHDRRKRPRRHRRCEKTHPGVPTVIKRAFDVTVSLVGLISLFPLLVLVAVMIKLDSAGPVFFRQERIGMRISAFSDSKVPHHGSQRTEATGGLITFARDPRITRAGWILRKTKTDELPQLINVLKGEMSLVGPRPEVARYVQAFQKEYEEILKVRPGMTDLASLKYRNEEAILGQSDNPEEEYMQHVLPDKIRLAKDYVQHSSFLFDLSLICRTMFKLFDYRMSA